MSKIPILAAFNSGPIDTEKTITEEHSVGCDKNIKLPPMHCHRHAMKPEPHFSKCSSTHGRSMSNAIVGNGILADITHSFNSLQDRRGFSKSAPKFSNFLHLDSQHFSGTSNEQNTKKRTIDSISKYTYEDITNLSDQHSPSVRITPIVSRIAKRHGNRIFNRSNNNRNGGVCITSNGIHKTLFSTPKAQQEHPSTPENKCRSRASQVSKNLFGSELQQIMQLESETCPNEEAQVEVTKDDNLQTSELAKRRFDAYGFEVSVGRPIYYSALCESDFEMTVYWSNLMRTDLSNSEFHSTSNNSFLTTKRKNPDSLQNSPSVFFKFHDKASSKTEGMKYSDAVMLGIPHEIRKHVWDYLARTIGDDLRIPGYYANLKKNGSHPEWGVQIQLDLNRTFFNHSLFRVQCGEGQHKLSNILNAYSYHNEVVGYCQGMNFIAATLLIVLEDEERAFWSLIFIMNHTSLWSYYEPEFSGLLVDTDILNHILIKYFPQINNRLKYLDLDCTIFLYRWLLQLFTNFKDWKLVLYIWDLIFLKGRIAILHVSLAILRIVEDQLIKYDSSHSAISFLMCPSPNLVNTDILIQTLKTIDIDHILVSLNLRHLFLKSINQPRLQANLQRIFCTDLLDTNLLGSGKKNFFSNFWYKLTTPHKINPKKLTH